MRMFFVFLISFCFLGCSKVKIGFGIGVNDITEKEKQPSYVIGINSEKDIFCEDVQKKEK